MKGSRECSLCGEDAIEFSVWNRDDDSDLVICNPCAVFTFEQVFADQNAVNAVAKVVSTAFLWIMENAER